MRQIIGVLRLKYEAGLSHGRIARVCGLSKGVTLQLLTLSIPVWSTVQFVSFFVPFIARFVPALLRTFFKRG